MKDLASARRKLTAVVAVTLGLAACSHRTSARPFRGIAEDPEPPSAGRVRTIVGGHEHACALYNDGTVACRGRGAELALGRRVPTYEATRIVGITGAKRLAVGPCNACALDGSGTVACWGHRGYLCEESARTILARPTRLEGIGRARTIGASVALDSVGVVDEHGAEWRIGTFCQAFSGSSGGACLRAEHTVTKMSDPDRRLGADLTEVDDLVFTNMPCVRAHGGMTRCDSRHVSDREGKPFVALRAPDVPVARVTDNFDETCFVLASGQVECRSTEGLVRPRLSFHAHTVATTGADACASSNDGKVACWRRPSDGSIRGSKLVVHEPDAVVDPIFDDVRVLVSTGFDICGLGRDDTVVCRRPDGEKYTVPLP